MRDADDTRKTRRSVAVAAIGAALAVAAGAASAQAATPPGSLSRADIAAPVGWVSPIAALHAPSTGRGITFGGSTLTEGSDPVVIVLSRSRRSILHVTTSFEAPCQSDTWVYYLLDAGAKLGVSRSGRFSGVQSGAATIGGQPSETTVSLAGRVTGQTMSGTIAYHAEITDQATGAVVDTCDRTERFRIVTAPGRVFAGQTSQEGPVVLELNASRTRVQHFHMAWAADCRPQGVYQIGDTLMRFPIRRARFGDVFTQKFSSVDGGQITFAYRIAGRIGKTRVTGTFRATRTYVDATGATAWTCSTGPLRFVARTG